MEENKSLQYTYGPDEKEILENLAVVEASVGEFIKTKQRELVSTKYYEEFVVNNKNGEPITLRNVFITAEKNEEGKMSYHFRWIVENENGEKSVEEKIIIDEEGTVFAIEGLKEQLGEIDLEELIQENEKVPGRLRGISEKDTQSTVEKIQNENSEKESKEINEDLKAQGQDLQLVNISKIKDTTLAQKMPETFGKSDEHAYAYSNEMHKFVMIEKKNEHWEINDRIEPAKSTWKTVISIGENGDKIEKKVPTALMKTNRSDREIALTIGQYGKIELETVEVLPCQARIARGIRQEGEGLDGQESKQVRDDFKAGGKEYSDNLAHQVEKIEDTQKENDEAVTNPITETDYIPNTDTTWGELMQETGESLPKLVERYNNELAKSDGKEEPKSIIQRIIEDYRMVSREHKQF